ncbi:MULTISPECIES: helix-turn-helix domain-containing protein [Aeromicrobium]|uniref:helix-turn-helix domain-containing protein n=1 Tax=Aeromicrobium TaxID=2040 RepID=UPI002581102B|nr:MULTISPECIES: helix-turn-helix domain-containing protein [Aeromicrobium]
MTNHTIAAPIRTWAELLDTDREVLNRTEVATLLDVDPRTIDRAIEDGTISVVRLGRRLLIPRRPFLAAFGVDPTSRPSSEVSS